MAFIDEQGKWTGPGPDPRGAGTTAITPQTFNANATPGIPAASADPDVASQYGNLLQGNSNYMAWKLSAGERADVAASNRKAALRALAVRFGGLPTGFKDVYGDLDQQTLDTAASNPLSDSARLAKSYTDSQEQVKRQLAARHALQSGDLGYGLGQLDYQHSADLYDQGQQVMDTAQGAVNQYGATLAGLSQEQIDQIRQAASDVYNQGYRLGAPNVGTGNPAAGGGASPNDLVWFSMPDGSGTRQVTQAEADAINAKWWADQNAAPPVNVPPVAPTPSTAPSVRPPALIADPNLIWKGRPS